MHRNIKDFLKENVNKKSLKESFEILNDLPEYDMTPHHVDMWYDRHTRSWVIQLKSKDDFQIGDADYIGNGKESALKRKESLEKQYKLGKYEETD
jgi:hypothetical protein